MTKGNIGSGSAVGLVEYLDTLVDKGRASIGAITPLKTAFVKVLEAVEGNDWQRIKVEDIDVNDYISRFANLTRGNYSTASISVYKSRMNRVIGWYQRFMSPTEAGWMPNVASRVTRKPRDTKNIETSAEESHSLTGADTATMNRLELVIRPGSKAVLVIPADITKAEVKKLKVLLNAVAVDSEETDEIENSN